MRYQGQLVIISPLSELYFHPGPGRIEMQSYEVTFIDR